MCELLIVIVLILLYFIIIYDYDYNIRNRESSNVELSNVESSNVESLIAYADNPLQYELNDSEYKYGPLYKGDLGDALVYLYNDFDDQNITKWYPDVHTSLNVPNSKEYWKKTNTPIEAHQWYKEGWKNPYYKGNYVKKL